MEGAPQRQKAGDADADADADALREGRRIYIGNLLYTIKPYEVEDMLAANGFGNFDSIHISIDPVSARNPGYCFVDLPDRAAADRALGSLRAAIRGRPIRVGPCLPRKPRDGPPGGEDGGFAFQRWGDWNASARARGPVPEQGPYAALDHFDDMVQGVEDRRLFIGGLGPMVDQAQNQQEIRQLLAGFNPTVIGKRITPHPLPSTRRVKRHYCFVDFETREEVNAASKALDGRLVGGGKIKAAPAGVIPKKLADHHADGTYSRRMMDDEFRYADGPQSEGSAPGTGRAMASSDWRRKS